MHGHMYSDSLGAAAGFAPERSSLTGGVPSVSNAGVVGGVIHRAAVLWVAYVRLRSVLVALYQSLSAFGPHPSQRPLPFYSWPMQAITQRNLPKIVNKNWHVLRFLLLAYFYLFCLNLILILIHNRSKS